MHFFIQCHCAFSAPSLGENENSNDALVEKIDVVGIMIVVVLLDGDSNVYKSL